MSAKTVYASRFVPLYVAYLRDARGAAAARALTQQFGLPEDVWLQREVDVDFDAVETLAEAVAEQCGAPFLGVRVAESALVGSYGLVEFIVRSISTLGGAIERIVRYRKLLNRWATWELRSDGRECGLSYGVADRPQGLGRHGNELAAALVVRMTREITRQPSWRPTRVEFSHTRSGAPAPLAAFFGTTEIHFGTRGCAIWMPLADLASPVATTDPMVLSSLERQAELIVDSRANDDFISQVRACILASQLVGHVSADDVADKLSLATRTLQRRLREHGTTFQSLVDATAKARVTKLMAEDQVKLEELATTMGYSDRRAFSRAFKRWTGMTPQAFSAKRTPR